MNKLLRELSDDDDGSAGAHPARPAVLKDPDWPWLRDFRAYLDIIEYVPDGWTTIAWWGVSSP
jgi:hypothetical protein